jgi:hypothetical protein
MEAARAASSWPKGRSSSRRCVPRPSTSVRSLTAIAFSGREPSLPEPTSPNVRVTDISRHERGIDVEFAIEGIRAKSLSKAHIVFVERADDPSGEKFRVYTGRIERSARGARVHALESDRVTVLRPQESLLAADVLRKIPKGGLVAVLSGIAELGGGIVVGGSWHYEDVSVRIIQDGSARHALLLPMAAGGTPAGLSPGSYRLTLAIDRARWATTAAANDVNRYRDSATVTFEL